MPPLQKIGNALLMRRTKLVATETCCSCGECNPPKCSCGTECEPPCVCINGDCIKPLGACCVPEDPNNPTGARGCYDSYATQELCEGGDAYVCYEIYNYEIAAESTASCPDLCPPGWFCCREGTNVNCQRSTVVYRYPCENPDYSQCPGCEDCTGGDGTPENPTKFGELQTGPCGQWHEGKTCAEEPCEEQCCTRCEGRRPEQYPGGVCPEGYIPVEEVIQGEVWTLCKKYLGQHPCSRTGEVASICFADGVVSLTYSVASRPEFCAPSDNPLP